MRDELCGVALVDTLPRGHVEEVAAFQAVLGAWSYAVEVGTAEHVLGVTGALTVAGHARPALACACLIVARWADADACAREEDGGAVEALRIERPRAPADALGVAACAEGVAVLAKVFEVPRVRHSQLHAVLGARVHARAAVGDGGALAFASMHIRNNAVFKQVRDGTTSDRLPHFPYNTSI